jgi:hypothetical protein
MSWLSWHEISERSASEAHLAIRNGDRNRALTLFGQAAETEAKAIEELDPAKTRTLGISAVSLVSLWFKAGELSYAEGSAMRWLLALERLPSFAVNQLRQLLQSIWISQTMQDAGVSFLPGQVIVSVKGGQTVIGGAPLDLIVEKVEVVQALFYRTIEYLKGIPHRRRGGPAVDVREACRPWLFQTQPGSYQFSVAVQEPRQPDFFNASGPRPEQIAEHFIAVLKATSEDPVGLLPEIIPAADYRTTFLKLARNLAPTEKTFGAIEIREAGETRPVVLLPETRTVINSALRPKAAKPDDTTENRELRGVLRALHLDKDWLELWVNGGLIRVSGLAEAVDDVIGPMVNKKVIVQAQVKPPSKRLTFLDIEFDE